MRLGAIYVLALFASACVSGPPAPDPAARNQAALGLVREARAAYGAGVLSDAATATLLSEIFRFSPSWLIDVFGDGPPHPVGLREGLDLGGADILLDLDLDAVVFAEGYAPDLSSPGRMAWVGFDERNRAHVRSFGRVMSPQCFGAAGSWRGESVGVAFAPSALTEGLALVVGFRASLRADPIETLAAQGCVIDID